MSPETCRAHHRSCGRIEEAGTGGARSAASKIENIFGDDGGTVSCAGLGYRIYRARKVHAFLVSGADVT